MCSAPLDASRLRTDAPYTPKPVPDIASADLAALKSATDRMIQVNWTAAQGWADPEVVPYGPLALLPTASALQYATECFEGMKVYRGHDGRLRLFRPMYNCERMYNSAKRVTLPTFEPEQLLQLIRKICALEAPKWLPPSQAGSALYIRPTLIATDSSLGFKVPDEACLCIFLIYWPTPQQATPALNGAEPKGMRLITSSEDAVRAWPGGTGAAKIGGNYGLALQEHARAKEGGYDQVLWLYGPDRQITEAGSTNVFIMWKTQSGRLEILTSPLDERSLILAGNTRRSVIELARDMFVEKNIGGFEACDVVERVFTMAEIEKANLDGRLVGMFAVGTAFWIQEVGKITHEERDIHVPTNRVPHVGALRQKVSDIVYGVCQSEWADLITE
ncbi:unnamed protein product [Clonostachys byssicola]|uniref:Branched-chain-amino-acid aminotransferase n=1 Tax=Clonostachys byssicola TaxID=160290 RepID=A0A9N9Y2T1_9HYPO|nr:unnamed protein product [Clonostachys byssicola]